ncbi:acyl-CoA dehydrogenase family protein [Croceicoccus gelatinilyticus]|uniref:acyl-CoA dehydrogenase family protein n=1 Tax=Croceicoccus gelatinilyticus TaxID=2835536 RepID=UPI001CEDCB56|nr:acyl-CoA dehydrogenase family protein [Croceicoccus gelatinilyticus]
MNTMTAPPVPDQEAEFLEVPESFLAEMRQRRGEFAALGRLPRDVVERLRGFGTYRALVAKRYGGMETTPARFLEYVETLATADGSVGWVASFGVSSMYLAALPEATLAKIYADGPDVIFAGALFPPQKAERCEGGLKISGRWPFGSGSTGADLIGVGIKVDEEGGGLPRMAVMPSSSATIEDNWDVIGLRGTGSHDIVVKDAVVSDDWTFVRGSAPSLDSPLYRYPAMAFAAQVLAIVGVGVGRAALDELVAMAAGRGSITGAPTLANRPYVQTEVAKAEAKLRSARAFFYEATEDAWATLCAGDPASDKQAMMLRLASSNVARAGCDVAQMAFNLSGTTGIYNDHPLSAFLHDALVVAQHAFLAEGTFQSAGRVMFDLDTPAGYP